MKTSVLALIITLIFLQTTLVLTAKYTRRECTKVVDKKVCKKVRREPFTKVIKIKVPVVKKYKVIEKRSVPYQQKICTQKKVKVAYQVPYETQKAIKVAAYKTTQVPYVVKVPYFVNKVKNTKVYYDKKYTVLVDKQFKVSYEETNYKKETVTKKSLCKKTVTENYTENVLTPYQATCTRLVKKVVMRDREVLESKVFQKKYWLGTYENTGKDCYKKKYGVKYYTKKVKVTKKVPCEENVPEKYPCVKKKLVPTKKSRQVVKSYECTKKSIKLVPFKVKKFKTVTRKVPEVRTKREFKLVATKYTEKKFREEKKYKTVVSKYYRTVYVKEFKFRTEYRYDHEVNEGVVTRYRTVHDVVTKEKTEMVEKTKVVPAEYYVNKCDVSYKTVCKDV